MVEMWGKKIPRTELMPIKGQLDLTRLYRGWYKTRSSVAPGAARNV